MKCPKCDKKMKVIKSEISNNNKKGKSFKQYVRKIYWCKNDDIWINVEIPAGE